jgi:flagellar biosynthesis regulator FlaF
MDEKDKKIKELEESLKLEQEKAAKILKEKKDMLKIFSEKDKEGMTENEVRLAEELEKARAELAAKAKADEEFRNSLSKQEQERTNKLIDQRIEKIAKGDKAVEEKLRANIALLDKMPRSIEAEIDAIANTAYNMLGREDVNPLAAIGTTQGGTPDTNKDKRFSDTDKGKAMAEKLGMTFVKEASKEGEGDKK